jgi:copper chaperone CopZ
MVKAIFTVDGMECPACSMLLEGIEDTLDGIHSIEASYHKGLLVIDYDEKKVSEAQISDEVLSLGYRVTGVTHK